MQSDPAPLQTTEAEEASIINHWSECTFKLCTGQEVKFDKLDQYPHSHIIGELRYVLDDGVKVTALALYEQSVPVTDPPPFRPPVRVEIIGDARRIKCTCCIRREKWNAGKAALRQMAQRLTTLESE